MPDEPQVAANGFFGKLPARGDFVSRGLPRGFTDPLDKWLSALTQSLTSDAETRSLYDSFRIRFIATPGLCGELGWQGVIVPSHDKAGRQYPLAWAFRTRKQSSHFLDYFALQEAYFKFEEALAMSIQHLANTEDIEDLLQIFARKVEQVLSPHSTFEPDLRHENEKPELAVTTTGSQKDIHQLTLRLNDAALLEAIGSYSYFSIGTDHGSDIVCHLSNYLPDCDTIKQALANLSEGEKQQDVQEADNAIDDDDLDDTCNSPIMPETSIVEKTAEKSDNPVTQLVQKTEKDDEDFPWD